MSFLFLHSANLDNTFVLEKDIHRLHIDIGAGEVFSFLGVHITFMPTMKQITEY